MQLQDVTFAQIVKQPAIYLLLVVISLMQFFIYKWADSSKEVIASKDSQIKVYEIREEKYIISNREKDEIIDSLQGLLLKRSDNSYDELKKMLNIEGQRNTIIIKPKEE